MNPQERKRYLFRRAKRMLEARGFGVKKVQSGGFILIDGESEKPIGQFETIEKLGAVLGLWGLPLPNPEQPDHDVATGLDTPETAAIREKIK